MKYLIALMVALSFIGCSHKDVLIPQKCVTPDVTKPHYQPVAGSYPEKLKAMGMNTGQRIDYVNALKSASEVCK